MFIAACLQESTIKWNDISQRRAIIAVTIMILFSLFRLTLKRKKKRWKWYSTKWIVTICWTYRLSLGRATTNANQREAQHAEFWRAERDRPKGVELCNVINHGVLKLNARNLFVSVRPYAPLMDIWLKTPGRQKWLEQILVLIRCWLDIIQAARATPLAPLCKIFHEEGNWLDK